jgi:hypothetical protein
MGFKNVDIEFEFILAGYSFKLQVLYKPDYLVINFKHFPEAIKFLSLMLCLAWI